MAVSADARLVADLMEDLVNTFGSSWREEQEKQQHISNRLKADVPLLVLKPKSLQEAFVSLEPVVALAVIVP